MPSFDIDINFNIDTDDIEQAKEILNELGVSATDINESMEEIDSTPIEQLSENTENASESAEELSSTLEQVTGTSLDNTSESAEELSTSLDDATNSSDNLSESMGIIEGGMLLGIGEQISGIASNSEDMAQGMDTASISIGQLAKNTGIAEPQMVALINNISNVTFPQNEAMAYVGALQQMGVSADKLGDSATNMDRINDATGMGYTKVMQLTQGLRSVGVQADNLPSAFNAIAYAQSNVNGGAETLSTVFKRQASTINEYGLSVDQTVLIMQKLSEQGVQGMKMGSELSNVLKENNGDIQAIEQSLGMASGSLENASSVTGKYEGQLQSLADEEMEHKTILERLGAVWEDVALQMSGVLSPLGSAIGMIGQVGSFGMTIKGLREIGSTLTGLRSAVDTIRNSESVWAGVKTVLAGATTSETIAEEANAAAKEMNAVATETETVANEMSLGAKISATASNWALAISENAVLLPLIIIVGVIAAVVGALWYLYNNNETVRASIDALRDGLMNLVGQFAAFASNIWSYLTGLWDNLVNWFNNLQTMTPAQIITLIAKVITTLNPLSGLIGGVLSKVLPVFITNATSWITNTVNKAKTLVSNVRSTVSQLPNKISSAVSGVTSAFTKPFQNAWNTISGVIDKVKNGINTIAQYIPSFGFTGNLDMGFEDYGFNLNDTLNTRVTSNGGYGSTNITNEFNINGIIEEEASKYIVDSVNNHIRKQNLIRGR